jgi:RES domain-containing protein
VGQAVIYTAENRSLALLEMKVQDEPLRAHYVLIPAFIPESVNMESIDITKLPRAWRTQAQSEALQSLGTQWLKESRSCVLAVPSAVMPSEFNFLINPLHSDFKDILIGEREVLDTDMRLH